MRLWRFGVDIRGIVGIYGIVYDDVRVEHMLNLDQEQPSYLIHSVGVNNADIVIYLSRDINVILGQDYISIPEGRVWDWVSDHISMVAGFRLILEMTTDRIFTVRRERISDDTI